MLFHRLFQAFIICFTFLFLSATAFAAIEWKPMKYASNEKEARLLFSFLEARPNNPDLFQKIGKLYESDGNMPEALIWYEKAVDVSPTPARLTILADRYGWVNKPRNSLKMLKRLRDLDPRNRDLLKRFAEVAGWADEPGTAGPAYEAAFPLFQDPELLRKAVGSYLAAKQPDKAKRVLHRLIRIQPRDPKNYEQLADVLDYEKDLPGSIEAYRKVFRLQPRIETLLKIAERLCWSNRANEAILACHDILARSPHHFGARLLLAEALESNGSKVEALRVLDSFKPKQLDDRHRLLRASLRLFGKDFPGAIQDAGTLLRTPFRNRALLVSGDAAKGLGDVVKAKVFLLEVLSAGASRTRKLPSTSEERRSAIRLLAAIARSNNALVEEENWLNRLEQEGDPDPYLLSNLADIARRRGAKDDAIRYLERSLDVASGPREIRRTLGELLFEQQKFDRALPHLEAALQANEDNAHLQELVFQCRGALGDKSGQLPLIWELFRRDPNRKNLDRLVEILLFLGYSEKAYELLMGALRRDPFDKVLEQRLKTLAENVPIWKERMGSMKKELVGRLYDEMVSSATRAIASSPENTEARVKRAEINLWRNRPKEALKDFLEARKRKPNDPVLLRRAASAAEWAAQKKDALTLRKELHVLAPEDATNTLRLAQELGWAGKLRQSLPYYERSRKDQGISPIGRD